MFDLSKIDAYYGWKNLIKEGSKIVSELEEEFKLEGAKYFRETGSRSLSIKSEKGKVINIDLTCEVSYNSTTAIEKVIKDKDNKYIKYANSAEVSDLLKDIMEPILLGKFKKITFKNLLIEEYGKDEAQVILEVLSKNVGKEIQALEDLGYSSYEANSLTDYIVECCNYNRLVEVFLKLGYSKGSIEFEEAFIKLVNAFDITEDIKIKAKE